MTVDVLAIRREPPDTDRAGEFGGEPMVQSFAVPLPGGGTGRAWMTTTEALAIPAFGRQWVGVRLAELADELGEKRLFALLAAGLRLQSAPGPARREVPELALAA